MVLVILFYLFLQNVHLFPILISFIIIWLVNYLQRKRRQKIMKYIIQQHPIIFLILQDVLILVLFKHLFNPQRIKEIHGNRFSFSFFILESYLHVEILKLLNVIPILNQNFLIFHLYQDEKNFQRWFSYTWYFHLQVYRQKKGIFFLISFLLILLHSPNNI